MKLPLGHIFLSCLLFHSGIAQWKQITSPCREPIESVVINDEVFLAGSRHSIYRSADAGMSWEIVGNDVWTTTLVVSDSTIFAGTKTTGVYRSNDNGNTWTAANNGLTEWNINSLTQYRNSVGKTIVAATDNGVFVSTDNANSWKEDNAGLETIGVLSLAVDTSRSNETVIYAGTGSGLYRYTNDSGRWIPAGLDTSIITGLAVSPFGEGSIIIAGTTSDGLFRSTDNGKQWQTIETGIPLPYSISSLVYNDHGDGTGQYFAGLENEGGYNAQYSVSLPKRFIFESNNEGAIWKQVNEDLSATEVSAISVRGTYLLAAGSQGGLYLSTNSGKEWNSINNGLPRGSVESVFSDDSVLVAICGNVTYTAGGYERVWIQTAASGLVHHIMKSDSNLVASGQLIMYSSDGGRRWSESENAPRILWSPGESGSYGAPVLNENQLYSQFRYTTEISINNIDKVMRSTDHGKSWSEAWRHTPFHLAPSLQLSADSFLFAITGGMEILRRTTNSAFWDTVVNGLGNSLVRRLVFDSAGTSGGYPHIFALTSTGIFQTIDYGNHWTIVPNIENITGIQNIWTINGYLYAVTSSGIYNSPDKGMHWIYIGSGLGDVTVNSLTVYDSDLLAATNDGIWRRPLSEITSVDGYSNDIPAGFVLHQNFPNPFNPSTSISFVIPVRNLVVLRIFDILGRPVATPVNEPKDPGTYSVQFDGSALASGLYFYQLQTGEHREAKKMLLLK